jgi:hypothetical protein
LGYDEDIGAKATLAQEDIRFSRTIQRIQKTIIAELNKVAMIHLYTHGYTEENLLDFELKLSNPSSIAQQQKLELIRTKFEIAAQSPEGIVDREWIRKHILDLNDDEIKRIELGKEKDKLRDMELEQVKLPNENQFIFGDEEEQQAGGFTGAGDSGGFAGVDTSGLGEETPGGEAGGGGLEGLFAGEMKSGKLMSEDELSKYDNLIDEVDEVSEEDKEKAKSSKGANVSNRSKKRGKYKGAKGDTINPLGDTAFRNTTTHMGALTGPEVIKASDLMDGVLPQSPVIEKFVDKQISHRMSKSLEDMSKALSIGNSNKILTEGNRLDDDILIDNDIFEDED